MSVLPPRCLLLSTTWLFVHRPLTPSFSTRRISIARATNRSNVGANGTNCCTRPTVHYARRTQSLRTPTRLSSATRLAGGTHEVLRHERAHRTDLHRHRPSSPLFHTSLLRYSTDPSPSPRLTAVRRLGSSRHRPFRLSCPILSRRRADTPTVAY